MGLSDGEDRMSIGCGVPKISAPQKRYGLVLSGLVLSFLSGLVGSGRSCMRKISYLVRTRSRFALTRN